MKKSIVWFAGLLLVPALATWLNQPSFDPDTPAPKETIVVQDSTSEEERHRQKEAWLKGMKKAAPGVNPERVEHQYRFERQQRLGFRNTLDSLAGGKVIGQFEERGCDFNSGRIMTVEWDTVNDLLYAQTMGGILYSGPEDGSAWQPVNEQFRMENGLFLRLIDHNGGQRLLSGTSGDYFYYSDDLGLTWDTATGFPNNDRSVRDVIILNDSVKTMYLLSTEWVWPWTNTIYRSTDHGTSFHMLFEFPESNFGTGGEIDMWSHRYEEAAFLVVKDSIYELIGDTARYFQGTIPGANGNMILTGYASDTHESDVLYAYAGGDIFRSNNKGVNWTFSGTTNGGPFRRNSFECSVDNKDHIFFGGVECWRSLSQGQTFFKVNNWWEYYGLEATKLHADIPGIFSFWDDNGNEELIICTDASLYKSVNDGLTVSNLGLQNLNVSRIYDHLSSTFEPGAIYVGTQDQGYQRVMQDNGGVLSFNQEISGDYGWLVSSDGGYSVWMNYPGFAMHWTDAPYGWAQSVSWDFNGANQFWLPPLMADPNDGYVAYLAGNLNGGGGSHMIKLTHSGDITPTQMPYNFNQGGAGDVTAMAYSPIDNNHWYVLTENGRFFHSSDAGSTWTSTLIQNAPGTHYFYGMYIYPSPDQLGTVYIGGSGYSNPAIYKSTNHGSGFTSMTNGLPPTLVHEITGDPTDSLLFAATEVGPFVYVSGDNQWYDLTAMGMPDVNCWSVEYIDALDVVRWGTHARGLWDLNLQNPAVSLDEEEVANWSVFPNPAWGQVRFSQALDDGVLMDLQGRVLRQWSTPIDRLDLSDLSTGKYVLRSSEGAQVIIKL